MNDPQMVRTGKVFSSFAAAQEDEMRHYAAMTMEERGDVMTSLLWQAYGTIHRLERVADLVRSTRSEVLVDRGIRRIVPRASTHDAGS